MPVFERTLSIPGLDQGVAFEIEFDVQPTGPNFENREIFIESAIPLRADDGRTLSSTEIKIATSYINSEAEKRDHGFLYQIIEDMLDNNDE